MPTTPSQFRFDADFLATVDALGAKLGLRTRANVLRHAVARLAETERVEVKKPPEKKSKKSRLSG
jgi:hypothetical protein